MAARRWVHRAGLLRLRGEPGMPEPAPEKQASIRPSAPPEDLPRAQGHGWRHGVARQAVTGDIE